MVLATPPNHMPPTRGGCPVTHGHSHAPHHNQHARLLIKDDQSSRTEDKDLVGGEEGGRP